MSLFDVLRYPISSPPTSPELTALPGKIYYEWVRNSSWREFLYQADDRDSVAEYYFTYSFDSDILSRQEEYKDDMALLRKLIKDYDEHL